MRTYRFFIQPNAPLASRPEVGTSVEEARELLAGHHFVCCASEALAAGDPRRDAAYMAVRSSSNHLRLRGVMFDATEIDDGLIANFAKAARQVNAQVHTIQLGEPQGVNDDPTAG